MYMDMSDSDSILTSNSAEFQRLCQAQIFLLSQSLNAVESIVYLTQPNQNDETKLIPIVVYPSSKDFTQKSLNLPLLSDNSVIIPTNSPPFLPINSEEISLNYNKENNTKEEDFYSPKYQLVVPLLSEDLVLGLLVTKRKDKEWNEQEFFQVENIANTIALALMLDQKQLVSQQQLKQQKQLNNLTQNHLDDFLHQLRNPLTALRTFTKLLLKKLPFQDTNYSIVENIFQQSDRLKDLIDDFNDDRSFVQNQALLSEQNKDSSSFLLSGDSGNLKHINIAQFIQPLLSSGRAIAFEKNIHFTTQILPDLPLVLSEEKALREILNNLIDNALKYTPSPGHVLIKIGEQKLINNCYKLAIEISDTGYGIPPEDQKHIFERHYRGIQEKSNIHGTGLGLAIVKDLCDKINAHIELFSPSLMSEHNSLSGTTFIVWLPIMF